MGVFLIIGIILFILWLLVLFVVSLGALIHVALVATVILMIYLAAESSIQNVLAVPDSYNLKGER